jgi:predicted anti-sigma-YlaC factor YlaD
MRSRHLSDEQALDLATGKSVVAEAQAHLEECDACRERVRQASEGWRLAVDTELPEPSPLYWESSRRRIGRAIDARESRLQYWKWATLAAGAAMMLATIAVLTPIFVGSDPDRRTGAVIEAWSALPNSDEDPSLPAIEAVLEGETEQYNGYHLGSYAMVLSDDEIRVVSESLREELGGSL